MVAKSEEDDQLLLEDIVNICRARHYNYCGVATTKVYILEFFRKLGLEKVESYDRRCIYPVAYLSGKKQMGNYVDTEFHIDCSEYERVTGQIIPSGFEILSIWKMD
jgi:hypothetical protein